MKSFIGLGLLVIGLLIVPTLSVMSAAGCVDGNTGNNTLSCDVTPPTAGNDDDQFDGDLGNDVMVQAAGVTTVDIDGDGSAVHDYRGNGNGGDDSITNYGTVTASIAGDWTDGLGGADTIYNYGYVQNNIMGDEANGAGGNDTITNGGTVNDTINGEGGNDTIIIIDGSSGGADNTLLLEGGSGYDVLIFRFNSSASAAQVASALSGKSPASGSATIAGKNYTWTNFEEFRNESAGSGTTATPTLAPTLTSIPTSTSIPTNPPPTSTSIPTNPPPTSTAVPTTAPSSTTVTFTINSGSNDANEVDGTLYLSNAQLGIGNANTLNTYTGLRFVNVNIPKGAVITSAQIQLYSITSQQTAINLNIAGEVSANSAVFSNSKKPSQRILTNARAVYSSDVMWAANTWYALTDVKAVVQEVVNTSVWQTGAPLTLVIKGMSSGMFYRTVNAYEGGSANAVRFVVTYTK